MRLLLADVSCGTDTPSFVSSVLKWRNNDREKADEVWARLDNANRALGEVLSDMVGAENEIDYEETMMAASELTSDEVRPQISSLSLPHILPFPVTDF